MAKFLKSKSDFDDRRRCCCKWHPKHRQSPGVCSLCLTEKLSQILSSTSSSSRKISDSLSSSSSSSSYYSSASSCSSCSSPNPYGYSSTDRRKALVFSAASSIFKKSRSMAFAPRLRRARESESGKKSNLGFWSRFLNRPRRKGMELEEVLTHSRSTVVVQRDVHG